MSEPVHVQEEREDAERIGEVDDDGMVYMGNGEWRRPQRPLVDLVDWDEIPRGRKGSK